MFACLLPSCPPACLPACLLACLPACLLACLLACLVCLFVVFLFVCLFVCLFVFLPVCWSSRYQTQLMLMLLKSFLQINVVSKKNSIRAGLFAETCHPALHIAHTRARHLDMARCRTHAKSAGLSTQPSVADATLHVELNATRLSDCTRPRWLSE